MNRFADKNSYFAVYPSQAESANKSRCWNWFDEHNQQRDQGEPSIIADITREVMNAYRIDAGRVFIAGMSAGGAMAVIMAATYPDLYAAVGSHSGMPYGAAKNVFGALSAMGNGSAPIASLRDPAIPIIVFQGDKDTRVHPRNSDQIISQWMSSHTPPPDSFAEPNRESNGRAYQRTIYRDALGNVRAEHWLVDGAGHAWSGGNPRGSHTDARGPNASREMLRFFLGGLEKPGFTQFGRSVRGLVRRSLRGIRRMRP